MYDKRAAQSSASLVDIKDKAYRKAVLESHNELRADFIEKVDGGLFFLTPFYEERVDRLFQQIKQSNPEFKDLASSQILLSFAKDPNAYAIGNGIVVINLPLLANLENEHELAFIICHELAHNLLRHVHDNVRNHAELSISQELKKKTREIEKQKYNKAATASKLYRKTIYSNRKRRRQVEFQADSLGFVLYKNAFIGRESAVIRSFATLDNIDKHKDSLVDKDYQKLFSSAKQPFKREWITGDEISRYKYDKSLKFWQIDSLKTHPDCLDRADRLKTLFAVGTADESEDTQYHLIAKQAQYDHILGLFVIQEFGDSLYNALLLAKDDPENIYLKKMIYANLVKIQDARNSYTLNKYLAMMSPKFSHSYNTFLSFLRQLRKNELSEIINHYSISE